MVLLSVASVGLQANDSKFFPENISQGIRIILVRLIFVEVFEYRVSRLCFRL
jgi:hypothetical protein